MSAQMGVDDSMIVFKRMHDINIKSIPLNPFEVINLNHWQLITYKAFSQMLSMSFGDMKAQISPFAFSFYSQSHETFYIVYNNEIHADKIAFNLSHEIGHILCNHISPVRPYSLAFNSKANTEEEYVADEFARFALGID